MDGMHSIEIRVLDKTFQYRFYINEWDWDYPGEADRLVENLSRIAADAIAQVFKEEARKRGTQIR